MHKRKDGKIIASLTEVKNKTGDIFALVDEFGEVTLTSYNKPKYRITKVDILETLKMDEEPEEKKKAQPEVERKSVIKKVADKFKSTPQQVVEETVVQEEVAESKEMIEGGEDIDLKTWDRNSSKEKSFTKKVLKPLQ